MLNKLQAFLLLLDTIKNGKRHQDYDHVIELAKNYKAYMTGKGLEEKLRQFSLREENEAFNQRVRLTNLITSCITGTLITPEKKIPAVKPVTKYWDYKKVDKPRKAELDKMVDRFYGSQGVEGYQKDVAMNLYDSDPNAFILYLFNNFDNRIEKPVTYATEISSKEAIDYQFVDNVLQYLTINKPIQYERVKLMKTGEKREMRDGQYFTIYSGNDQIVFSQIDEDSLIGTIPEEKLFSISNGVVSEVQPDQTRPRKSADDFGATYYFRFGKKNLYQVLFFEPKAKRVPAYRVGNIPDLMTDRRTCVNGWHNAIPHLDRSISAISELDLSVRLHVFPQKFEYSPRCQGSPVKTGDSVKYLQCTRGYLPDGKTCSSCKGSGWETHTSAQDTIRMAMPRNPDDAFDLEKLVFYARMPIEIVKWLDEYNDKVEIKCIRAVYNSDIFVKTGLENTATGKIIDMQSVYDALNPQAQRYSYGVVFSVEQIAIYLDLDKDLVVKFIFPKNLGFESFTARIERLKMARDAGVNDYTLGYMNTDITSMVFEDQPDLLKKIEVKSSFFPFVGKSENTIMSLISQNNVTRYNKVLFSEFESIFSHLESQTYGEDQGIPVSFYDLARTKQKELIDKMVNDIIAILDKENPVRVDNPGTLFQ